MSRQLASILFVVVRTSRVLNGGTQGEQLVKNHLWRVSLPWAPPLNQE